MQNIDYLHYFNNLINKNELYKTFQISLYINLIIFIKKFISNL